MTQPYSRREFLSASVAAATAAAVGLPGFSFADLSGSDLSADPMSRWKWDKGVCRFCGVGCGIEIATRDGRVTAVRGDAASPVNRGLLCVKGYANAEIPYGADRLTHPLLRMKDGRFDKQGEFVPVSWQRAFDEMEREWRRAHAALGPTGVGIMGSGQYTIQEGYAASKLVKAGWRSNNLDPNARHCMASAVAAFMQTFGIDEPSGCYDDIEATDTVVLWGSNMAEMHPMLWSRIIDQRLRREGYRIFNLTTFHNRSSEAADIEIVFKPNTDLAIWNYIAREIVRRGAVDQAFVDKHCVFAAGPTDIGYGMRASDKFAYAAEKDTQARETEIVLSREEAILAGLDPHLENRVQQASTADPGKHWLIPFEEFKKALEPYNLDFVAALAQGDPDEPHETFRQKLVLLADQYADPKRNVVSYWTMGFNQHTRGTWVNEQAYMVHLLTGKQARPGAGAFSLTGQPSACGTAREVGTLAHESGHSMHTYLADQHQPYVTHDYATFVAEVASTLNENLLFHYMLDHTKDKATRLFLLGSYLDNLRTTLFRQTMFAEFELAIHEKAEKGEPLSGEGMSKIYLGILRKYYGHDEGVCKVDELYGVEWSYIPHFFYDFYVYQYATSIVASTAIANGIRDEAAAVAKSGKKNAPMPKRDAYLMMLSSGSSQYPIDLLKGAGVDMTTSAPFNAAIREMNLVMDEMEKLLK